MNKLYAALTAGFEDPADWYYKSHTAVAPTERASRILAVLTGAVPYASRQFFAYCVCCLVRLTSFWGDIAELDSENTYSDMVRDPDSFSDSFYTLTAPDKDMEALVRMLDKDIADRLQFKTWSEVTAAACLQILRETI